MGKWIWQTIIIVLLAAVLALEIMDLRAPSRSGGEAQPADTESIRRVASALKSEGLFDAAVKEYRRLLDRPDLSPEQKANTLLLIGEMQREDLKDYEGALASYVRIRTLYPGTSAVPKAEREMVTCLELLDRGRDAQRQLARVADLQPPQEVRAGDVVVARIGDDREITLREIEREIESLPEYVRKTYQDPAKKAEFARTFLARELMRNMALRKGYDRDPEIRRQVESLRRDLLANRIYEEEVRDRVEITDGDVDLYYRANVDRYAAPERVRVAHIRTADPASARAVLESVTEGTDFGALARERSDDASTKESGGLLPAFSRQDPVPGIGRSGAFAEAAFTAEIGEVTGPIQTDAGWHLMKIVERIPPATRPLEEVRAAVENAVRVQKEEEAFRKLMERMLKAQKAVVYEDTLQTGGP